MPKALKEKRKVRLDVLLDPEIDSKLYTHAKKKGITKTSIVEEALREYFERHKEQNITV